MPKKPTPNSFSDHEKNNAGAVLFELAERAGGLFRRSNADAMICGRVLLEAREIAGHGQWLPFLRDAGVTARTAQRLMKVAEFVGDNDTKCAFLSHFGMSRTLDFIRASGRSMAAWRAACADDPTNSRLITSPPENAFFGLFLVRRSRGSGCSSRGRGA